MIRAPASFPPPRRRAGSTLPLGSPNLLLRRFQRFRRSGLVPYIVLPGLLFPWQPQPKKTGAAYGKDAFAHFFSGILPRKNRSTPHGKGGLPLAYTGYRQPLAEADALLIGVGEIGIALHAYSGSFHKQRCIYGIYVIRRAETTRVRPLDAIKKGRALAGAHNIHHLSQVLVSACAGRIRKRRALFFHKADIFTLNP